MLDHGINPVICFWHSVQRTSEKVTDAVPLVFWQQRGGSLSH